MTMPTLTERAQDEVVGDPPPPDRHQRRRFDADYKLTILADYDRMSGSGEKGAFLRREGLYSSQITDWRRAREAGLLNRSGSSDVTSATATSAPKTASPAVTAAALAKETRRADRAEAELAKHKLALEIMGKAHALLEMLAESADSDPKPKN
jgi:transposase